MKMSSALQLGYLALGLVIGAELQAADSQFRDRYYNLSKPTDLLVLKANEVAIIDKTVSFDWSFNWMNILYKQGTNDFINIILPLGLTGGTMPLAGPGVIMLNANDAFVFGAEYTGAVGLKIVPRASSERYATLASPDDRLVLKSGETAIIDGTVSFGDYAWMNLLYKQGTNDFVNISLPLGLNGFTMPLAGPGVILLNTNDVFEFGAEYTGAVGLKIVPRTSSERYATLANPDDRLVLKANETAIIDGTVGFDCTYNWMNILYKHGKDDSVSISLPLWLSGTPMPLTGPGVILLDTNDAFVFGAEYTGAVGLEIVSKNRSHNLK